MEAVGRHDRHKSWATIGVHVLCWAIYIAYEVFFETIFEGAWHNSTNYVYFYLFNISLFYIHAHVVLPYALRSKLHALWKTPLFVVAEIFFFVALQLAEGVIAGDMELHFNGFGNFVFDVEGLEYFVVPLLPYVLYSTGYYFLRRYMLEQRHAKEVERQHFEQLIANQELEANLLRMEQEYLRAQVNPHLLYNTLSFVNYAAKHNPNEAERAIVLLSDIMRYALEPAGDAYGLVRLEKEIQQAEKLIELNQLRFSGRLHIRLSVDGDAGRSRVIPLMLLTLVENIFKHGELRKAETPALIRISLEVGMLSIKTENLVRTSQHLEASTKKGLRNLAERLELQYAFRHAFHYGVYDGLFCTSVTVRLQKEELSQPQTHPTVLSR